MAYCDAFLKGNSYNYMDNDTATPMPEEMEGGEATEEQAAPAADEATEAPAEESAEM